MSDNDEMNELFEEAREVDPFNRDNIWNDPSKKKEKDVVISSLLRYFSAMVKPVLKEYSLPDNSGRYKPDDYVYHKLLDSSDYVLKAKRLLLKKDNGATRDFTIYISNQRWVNSKFRPLFELCSKDDSLLAMRCCSLALVLAKGLSDKAKQTLSAEPKARKKSVLDLTGLDEDDRDSAPPTEEAVVNAREQLAAMLSFKEALCSPLCNEAVTNAFREFWSKEQTASEDDNKIQVAVCFSYIRRLLAIQAHPNWSTPGEIVSNHRVHHKYIFQLKQVLSVIPGICSDLDRNRQYHDGWLPDLIQILHYVFQDFDAKQLFLAYKTGALIKTFSGILDDTTDGDAVESHSKRDLRPTVVPALFKDGVRSGADAKSGGGLMAMIKKDQAGRQARAAISSGAGSDSNRFRGVYRVNLTKGVDSAGASSLDQPTASINGYSSSSSAASQRATVVSPSGSEAADGAAAKATAMIFRNPFSTSDGIIPQVRAKASKKNLTFSTDTSGGTEGVTSSAMGEDFQQACIVAASLSELLTNELALKALVRRANEEKRREEHLIGRDVELKYFSVMTKLLAYHRLKIADDFAQFTQRKVAGAVWEPNVKNVMDSLDKLSFNRVLDLIGFLLDKDAPKKGVMSSKERLTHLHTPIALWKEMVCYLRVLLESGLEGHHEIAVAGLNRLYYSTDRIDPLQKLLGLWRPGALNRKFIDSLVEMLHETFATLDAARRVYNDGEDESSGATGKKKKVAKKSKDQSLETYIVNCMRFDVNDYFHRHVNNNSVRMYTRLLQNYDSNDAQVNVYAYRFLQRMCAFKIEQMCKAPMPSPTGAPVALISNSSFSDTPYEEVHLGFMLFNVQTLSVFSTIASDPEVCSNAPRYNHLRPLVALIHSLVRRFGDAASKNRMLFVELLFQHPRPDSFCCHLDSVYEAPLYASSSSGGLGGSASKKRRGGASDDDSRSANSSDDEQDDFGDEFDENDAGKAFAASSSDQPTGDQKPRKRDEAERRVRPKKLLKQKKNEWLPEEDDVLRELYLVYAGSSGIFSSITESSALRAHGRNRNEHHVRARCAALKLSAVFDSDDEDQLGGDELDSPQRRPRRAAALIDQDTPVRGGIDEGEQQEEDTYPQSAAVTQETNQSFSPAARATEDAASSSRKKARLVQRDSAAELPRAAWDTDDATDVFEQRSLGLSSGGGNSKRLMRKTNVGVDSDDDNMFGVEDDIQREEPPARPAKPRSMQIESDDEEQ